jgi:hypothetical protein
MKLTHRARLQVACVLYFGILFGSLLCAIGHGQVPDRRLSHADAAWCAVDGGGVFMEEPAGADLPLSSATGCVITSLFCASLLAVFFGLLARLAGEASNPRASPARLPVF